MRDVDTKSWKPWAEVLKQWVTNVHFYKYPRQLVQTLSRPMLQTLFRPLPHYAKTIFDHIIGLDFLVDLIIFSWLSLHLSDNFIMRTC